MNSFFTEMNYSSVNEDAESEFRALQPEKKNRILCITGSGARTLDLLTKNPREIVSIDLNPAQNHLLELKIAAIRKFEYPDYLAFLGVLPSGSRELRYLEVRNILSRSARTFWDNRNAWIRKGVFYQGNWERYFLLLAHSLNLWRPRKIQKLFDCRSVDEQKQIWTKEWNTVSWRLFLMGISQTWCWRYLLRDPAFFKFVPSGFSVNRYLQERFNLSAGNILFRESPFLILLMKGKLKPEGSLPPHLKEENFETLRKATNRVSIVSASVVDQLQNPDAGTFDAFSLSDVSSYLNENEYETLWTNIIRSSAADAGVCERQFLVKRSLAPALSQHVYRDKSLEHDLEYTDKSAFYSFICGRISGGRT